MDRRDDRELAADLVRLDGTAVLTVRGDIDLHSAPTLTTATEHAVSMGVPVVVDQAGVTVGCWPSPASRT
jgi:anti-anti-sigma regulatory factor